VSGLDSMAVAEFNLLILWHADRQARSA